MSELLLDVPVDVRSAATERMAAACVEGSRSCGSGLRIEEALALTEGDLDHRRESLLVRRGKGGRRREAGMDAWEWEQLQPWVDTRRELPVGPLLCVINVLCVNNGTTCGRQWSQAAARAELPPRHR